ncbi:MAG: hypothetical protein JXA07_16075 [Spirochaetes bacterium]|nr:hypothetical protein [Spirochaetota bacterium]
MKKGKLITAVVLMAIVALCGSLAADTLQRFQSALVFLQKARMTSAVQAKNENLKSAKENLLQANYDRGGNRAAALAHTMQAIARVNEFNLEKANREIDMAIVKVKHSILTLKQETQAKKKSASVRK